MTTAQDLRRVIGEIRRRLYPISDLIPLLDAAATEIESFTKTFEYHQSPGTGVSVYSQYPEVCLMNKELYYTLLEKAGMDG